MHIFTAEGANVLLDQKHDISEVKEFEEATAQQIASTNQERATNVQNTNEQINNAVDNVIQTYSASFSGQLDVDTAQKFYKETVEIAHKNNLISDIEKDKCLQKEAIDLHAQEIVTITNNHTVTLPVKDRALYAMSRILQKFDKTKAIGMILLEKLSPESKKAIQQTEKNMRNAGEKLKDTLLKRQVSTQQSSYENKGPSVAISNTNTITH